MLSCHGWLTFIQMVLMPTLAAPQYRSPDDRQCRCIALGLDRNDLAQAEICVDRAF